MGPVASTRGYYENNENPGIGYDVLPRFTVGQESDSGQSVNVPEAKAIIPPAQPETRLEGLIPNIGRAAVEIGSYGLGELGQAGKSALGAAKTSLRVDELMQLLDYIRKQAIRREPVVK